VPKSGQALVKVRAFGLNRMDTTQREGNYPVSPQAGKILGVEFSGIIEAFGEGDAQTHGNFMEGDAVFGLAYGGAYAEYIAVNTKMLLHKPETMRWEEAAGIPEVSAVIPFRLEARVTMA
jgi:NADPH:quinone reductase-like Zn-dependent oxidoreductase